MISYNHLSYKLHTEKCKKLTSNTFDFCIVLYYSEIYQFRLIEHVYFYNQYSYLLHLPMLYLRIYFRWFQDLHSASTTDIVDSTHREDLSFAPRFRKTITIYFARFVLLTHCRVRGKRKADK